MLTSTQPRAPAHPPSPRPAPARLCPRSAAARPPARGPSWRQFVRSACIHGSVRMGACVWERAYGSVRMGACVWERAYGRVRVWERAYGSVCMGGCVWERAYGRVRVWERVYGSVRMGGCVCGSVRVWESVYGWVASRGGHQIGTCSVAFPCPSLRGFSLSIALWLFPVRRSGALPSLLPVFSFDTCVVPCVLR
eukprot:189483-Chlamydomonas_euryale.AAC.5